MRRAWFAALGLLTSLVLVSFPVPVRGLDTAVRYEVWCDCNGDGQADIHKKIWIYAWQDIQAPGVACPACCCKLLRFENVTLSFDPLPLSPPSSPVLLPQPVGIPQLPGGESSRSIFVPYSGGAALIDVRIKPAGIGSWYLAKGLVVDTGAGITLFPKAVAVALGLSLKTGQQITLSDVSGTSMSAWCHRIEIQFLDADGKATPAISILAAFAETDEVPTLLGRKDVLELLDIVFQDDGFRISIR